MEAKEKENEIYRVRWNGMGCEQGAGKTSKGRRRRG